MVWAQCLWTDFTQWWNQNSAVVPRDDYNPLLDVSGFLGILAFSVAVFTLASPKFKIRQATAIIPFQPLFFGTLQASAIMMMTVEAFIIFELKVPSFLNLNAINYIITAMFAFLILYWMKVCFIMPPRFTNLTAKHFFDQALHCILNGSKEEMLALAREITREAERLIYHASPTKIRKTDNKNPVKTSALQSHAYKILSLLSDTRFCDAVGKEIPTFPAIMVGVAVSLKRYDAPIQLMVRRTVIAMLKNKESALFVENEWLGQGFIGNTKPITRAVFENWHFLEKHELGLESPLDLDYPYARTWDVDTWRVYFGMAREYIHGLTSTGHSNWDARGIYYILKATGQAYEQLSDLKKCEDVFNQHNPIWHARVRTH